MVEPLLMERRASYIASETKLLTNIEYICIVSALLTINKRSSSLTTSTSGDSLCSLSL